MAVDNPNLLFDVRRSVRYHDRRLDYYEKMSQLTSFLTILLSGSILLQIAGAKYEPPWWLVLISLVAALLAAFDIVVGYTKMLNLHKDLRRRFCLLEAKTLNAKTDDQLNKCNAEKITIELDEPPVYRALDLLCYNEVMIANGYKPGDPDAIFAKLSNWHKLTCHIWRWPNIGHDLMSLEENNKVSKAKVIVGVLILLGLGVAIGNQYANYKTFQDAEAAQAKDKTNFVINNLEVSKLSDRSAKEYALNMLLTIDKAKKDFAIALDNKDFDLYRAKVDDELLVKLNNWPETNLKNNAIFPYSDCRQAADDYRNYTADFFNDKASNIQKNKFEKQFNTSYAGCQASIKNPDMSLKDIE